ncbi:MAG: pyruvate, phosphate dikinase, partial [Chloroflexi bacterium]|nr:pyruvate, phosphate dikinase [Chloroflexota bacterium]
GFVVSISAWRVFAENKTLPEDEIKAGIKWLEGVIGRKFEGGGLMVSVRSSGPVSMPGMMDTVLNVADSDTLYRSVKEIFASWYSPRAIEYRRINDLPGDLGTAAIIQAMVMGNAGERCGTGVLFTRNPNDGVDELFGEYMENAQGEDLVSGARTPEPLSKLKDTMPEIYDELVDKVKSLEKHYSEMQDIEFTIEHGKLYILQTRTGKRTGPAAVRIAVELANEGLITREGAILRVTPAELELMLHESIDRPERFEPFLRGLAAAPGSVTGHVIFDTMEAAAKATEMKVILVRPETTPDDIHGIAAAHGVLTSRGGLSSHAAIVTRAMGKPCVTGAEDADVNVEAGTLTVGDTVVKHGDLITMDGASGAVYLGELPMIEGSTTEELDVLLGWADKVRRLGTWANGETPDMVAAAQKFGAEGIGLARTERQFSEPESLRAIRRFILADSDEERTQALKVLHGLQKQDFIALFKQLDGMPVIVRLLDLPLHEFLPEELGRTDPQVAERRAELAEVNPMMGHRGVRLGITHPELYKMQVDAIQEARAEVAADVRVMIPQVLGPEEVREVKKHINSAGIKVGVMMETARACLVAGEMVKETDFFSFGTNDLTQATFSFSREDAEGKFLSAYLEKGVLQDNPFEILDADGVAKLMEMAVKAAREVDPDFHIGICGEHGGNPRSIAIAHRIGLTYVSCSPYRVPIARLAAAQAALNEKASA